MEENRDTTNTVKLHRVLKAPVEHVYRAFVEPKALCKWMAPHGYIAEVHAMDVRVGGKYRMSFTNFRSGQTHSFGGTYLELKPNELMRYTDIFDDPTMPGEIQVTVTLKEVMCGTELIIVQENLPVQIPVEMCYLGWQESLGLLAFLTEPKLP